MPDTVTVPFPKRFQLCSFIYLFKRDCCLTVFYQVKSDLRLYSAHLSSRSLEFDILEMNVQYRTTNLLIDSQPAHMMRSAPEVVVISEFLSWYQSWGELEWVMAKTIESLRSTLGSAAQVRNSESAHVMLPWPQLFCSGVPSSSRGWEQYKTQIFYDLPGVGQVQRFV